MNHPGGDWYPVRGVVPKSTLGLVGVFFLPIGFAEKNLPHN